MAQHSATGTAVRLHRGPMYQSTLPALSGPTRALNSGPAHIARRARQVPRDWVLWPGSLVCWGLALVVLAQAAQRCDSQAPRYPYPK